ncbi:sensor histidine kinase [Actinomadura keratinilytica]
MAHRPTWPMVRGPAWSRLGMTFQLLMLFRGLLLAMALVLMPASRLDPGFALAVAALAAETALAAAAWRTVLPWLRRRPVLCCLDGLPAYWVLAEGGVYGEFFPLTVMTSGIAGVLYPWRRALPVCAVQVVLCLLAMASEPAHGTGTLLGLPAFYPLTACAGAMLRRLLAQYAAAEEERRRIETAVAAAAERTRLAREMHDSLAKTLQGMVMSAAALPVWIRKSPDRAERDARHLVSALETATREARGLIADLREEAYGLPLPLAVRRVAVEWSRSSRVAARTDLAEAAGAMDAPTVVRHEVVAVLKEALTNVERHACADRVEVRLRCAAGRLELTVRDDGAGFAPPPDGAVHLLAREGHYGLVGMAERARRVGGALTVDSAPGEGTTVTMTLPWPYGSADPDAWTSWTAADDLAVAAGPSPVRERQ